MHQHVKTLVAKNHILNERIDDVQDYIHNKLVLLIWSRVNQDTVILAHVKQSCDTMKPCKHARPRRRYQPEIILGYAADMASTRLLNRSLDQRTKRNEDRW